MEVVVSEAVCKVFVLSKRRLPLIMYYCGVPIAGYISVLPPPVQIIIAPKSLMGIVIMT